MTLKDFNSTSFGLLAAYLLPGTVILYSFTFWSESAARAFRTFLTEEANIGLFLFLLLGALTLGLVATVVRWFLYERLPGRFAQRLYGPGPADHQWMGDEDRFAAHGAIVDENYRFHQFCGGLTIALPALFVGWLRTLDVGVVGLAAWVSAAVALEALLVAAAIESQKRYRKRAREILAKLEAPTQPAPRARKKKKEE